ncbi:hypothetical protein [Methylorubrum sp. DB1722]|uniref:hypothetical protein n=1 Tax=Methylorubrum sp. DB1722 TaxID=2478916 RepID=UPI0018E338CB|nr:hypothetical protein [Methylorubrum sp. DB1722]MBI1689486.1 hypothetical protein [Methylorubrum sp. DB1722]
MMTLEDIDAHRRAAFQGLIDRCQQPWLGSHAEYAAAQALEGSVHDEGGGEVRLTMQHMTPGVRRLAYIEEEPPREVRHPFRGANRQARRAAEARARRRA